MNALAGGLSFCLLRLWAPRQTSNSGIALFWLAVTQTGHAVGYSLDGLINGEGDASALTSLEPMAFRVLLGLGLGILFLGFSVWAIRGIVGITQSHFQFVRPRSLYWAVLLGFVMPFAVVVLIAQSTKHDSFASVLAYEGSLFLAFALISFWSVRSVLRTGVEGETGRVSGKSAILWSVAAALTFMTVALWLENGVSFSR